MVDNSGYTKVHNGRNKGNSKTQFVKVEKRKCRRPTQAKPVPERLIRTITPQFIDIVIDGEPGSNRLAAAFQTGLCDNQKAHIKKELLVCCKDEIMRIRWRTGQGKDKGLQFLCMNVRIKGRRRTNPCCPVTETKMDVETYLRQIIRTMT